MAFNLSTPDRDRAIAMLVGFHGLVPVLEPALAAELGPDWTAGRDKSAILKADLIELGLDPATLPICADAAQLVSNRAGALGVLYVLEGSTLGGNLIAKALRKVPAWPAGRPTYFHPYGENTGAMWRRFVLMLDAEPVDRDAVIAGANRTFAEIGRWFTRQERP